MYKIKFIVIIISIVIIAIGLVHSISLSFVNDDAFISFRYAKNSANGLGLVFNQGERVEGYSNFLWTLLISSGIKFGIDPVIFSTVIGIIFYTLTLIVFIFLSYSFQKGKQILFIPLTALILIIHRDFNAYATSGLETSFVTFFISLVYVALTFANSPLQFFISGILMSFLMLIRADSAIYLIASIFYLYLTQKHYVRNLILFLFPILVIFTSYWVWRYHYYGYIFPNTFYAKSINLPYYSQGLNFVWLYIKVYYGLLLLPFILIIVLVKNISNKKFNIRPDFKNFSNSNKSILLASLFVLLYIFFVMRIGGDFMHARLLIPITPLLFFIFEQILLKFYEIKARILFGALMLFMIAFRNDIFEKELNVGYVVDEVKFYTANHLNESKNKGKTLKKYLENLPIKMAFGGSQLRIAYYSDVPYAIEADGGLTNTFLAHQKIVTRGRPGHEKSATREFLQKIGVHFFMDPRTSNLTYKNLPINAIWFDSVYAEIITYDKDIMTVLEKKKQIRFIKMPEYLDAYFNIIDSIPEWQIQQNYKFFKDYYFIPSRDTIREQYFLKFLSGSSNDNP